MLNGIQLGIKKKNSTGVEHPISDIPLRSARISSAIRYLRTTLQFSLLHAFSLQYLHTALSYPLPVSSLNDSDLYVPDPIVLEGLLAGHTFLLIASEATTNKILGLGLT